MKTNQQTMTPREARAHYRFLLLQRDGVMRQIDFALEHLAEHAVWKQNLERYHTRLQAIDVQLEALILVYGRVVSLDEQNDYLQGRIKR